MPPKASPSKPNVENESKAVITALCHLIMSSSEFQGDNSKLAPILNIAQAKNVPRKINSIINPYGFEYKSSKVFEIGAGDDVPATPPPVASCTTPVVTPKKTQASAGKKSTPASAKSKSSKSVSPKKRKLIEVEEAVEDAKEEDIDAPNANGEDENLGTGDSPIKNGDGDED